MNRFLTLITASLVGFAILAPVAFAEPNLEAGKTQFQVCLACHGPTASGNKDLGAPRIAGQAPWYLKRQIKNLKAGMRGVDPRDTYGLQMRPISLILVDDQTVEDVIAYIGTLTPEILPKTITGDAAAGKELYTVCAACHGANGKGVEALGSPRLQGIPDWYLARQLSNYKDGIRGFHKDDVFGIQMKVIQNLLLKDDKAINNVIAYINTLE